MAQNDIKILMAKDGIENSHQIDVAMKHGAYSALEKAFKMENTAITSEVKTSGVRGRGGAGFPAGIKWGFMPIGDRKKKPNYVVVNADESEPGTFKDRWIIEKDPHMLIEGIIITSYAVEAHVAYIYIRGEYHKQALILEKAIEEAYEKGFLGKNIMGSGFDLDLTVHRGAGAYICGEETALLNSLEGRRGYPRIKPPYFPAAIGVFMCPTLVNNVETISNVPWIIEHGGEKFAEIGKPNNTGTKLLSVSGHVNLPGVYEVPLGLNLMTLINDYCGGIRDGHKLKAVIPGGSSMPVLKAEECDVDMDFDALKNAGSSLGSGGVIVMDETTCMVDVCLNLLKFYAHESCGQCTPCREGMPWMARMLQRIKSGEGRPEDIELVLNVADYVGGDIDFSRGKLGKTICALGEAGSWPTIALINKYRDEFEHFCKNHEPLIKRDKSIKTPKNAVAEVVAT